MGLDVYLRCDGRRIKSPDHYGRISGMDYSFRNYVAHAFDVPESFGNSEPILECDWEQAYGRLLLWLKLNKPDNDWVPTCLKLMQWCHEALHWGPERHELEWWG